ncbi:MAG: type II toxin-antitoxin system RelE family toxin [Nitrospiraceae bacterium]
MSLESHWFHRNDALGESHVSTGYPAAVAERARHLPPDIKRGVKAAIRALSADPSAGEPLLGELEGFWKYRVNRFRLVYAVDRKFRVIKIVAVDHRR